MIVFLKINVISSIYLPAISRVELSIKPRVMNDPRIFKQIKSSQKLKLDSLPKLHRVLHCLAKVRGRNQKELVDFVIEGLQVAGMV